MSVETAAGDGAMCNTLIVMLICNDAWNYEMPSLWTSKCKMSQSNKHESYSSLPSTRKLNISEVFRVHLDL